MPSTGADRRPAALEGVRVLDLSRHLPGPYCTMVLGDLGADVLKVEEPGTGDPARWIGPRSRRVATLHAVLNRNKRSITLDLRTPGGKEILRRLVPGSDVLVETFRPGVMDRLGLGAGELARLNPRLVHCSITGYGQDGPHRHRAGHDIDYQALAGLLGLAGEPRIPGLQIADIAGGALPAVIGVLAALTARARTGEGQTVDVSMYEGALALAPWAFSRLLGGVPEAPTELTGSLPCYGIYRTSDGRHMALGALEPKFWAAFCRAVGREDLVDRHLVPDAEREEVRSELTRIFAARTFAAWQQLASATDCCLEPVRTLEEALADPLTLDRSFLAATTLPDGTRLPLLPTPIRLSGTPAAVRSPAPRLGEHTAEILSALGLTAREQQALSRAGATALRSPLRRFGMRVLEALGATAERGLGIRSLLRRDAERAPRVPDPRSPSM